MITINIRKWFVITILTLLCIGIASATVVQINPLIDNTVARSVVNTSEETISAIRNGSGTTLGTNGSASYTVPNMRTGLTDPNFTYNKRGILIFDTSSLGAGANVTAVNLSLVPIIKATGLGSWDIVLAGGHTVANTSLVTADYGTFDPIEYAARVSYTAPTAATRYNFTLTNTTFIDPTGYSTIYLLSSWDFDNSFTGTWSYYNSTYWGHYGVNNTDTTIRPYLEITYTGGGPSAPVANFSQDVSTVPVGGTIHFTDTSTGTPTNWSWEFCDTAGCVASVEQNPTYTFGYTSTWRVALNASNAYGYNQTIRYGFPTVTAANIFYASLDGYAQRDLTNTTAEAYSTIRNGTGSTAVSSATSIVTAPFLRSGNSSNTYARLRRGIMVFDTHTVGNTTITNATLSFVKTTGGSTLGVPSMGITGGSVISNTALSAGDYQNFTNTEYATRVSTMTTGERKEIPISDVSLIDKDGYTVIFLRDAWDIDNSGPTWTSYNDSYFAHDSSQNTNTSLRPYLILSYSAVAPVAHFYMNRSDEPVTPPEDTCPPAPTPGTVTIPDNTSYGAELANTTAGYYIGGGFGYHDIKTTGDHIVTNKSGLIAELFNATAGETIFVDGNVTIDLTGTLPLAIPAGVTLASDRGYCNYSGAIIKKTAHTTGFIGNLSTTGHVTTWLEPMFYANGNDVRVTGLRLYGEQVAEGYAGDESKYLQGVFAYSRSGFEVDNNVIRGWSWAGVTADSCPDAWIHHNYIYENQGANEAYGVSVTGTNANATAEYNLFNRNRHSITGDGEHGEKYTFRYNIIIGEGGSTGVGWAHIDIHESGSGGYAGDTYVIHHNTVMSGGTQNPLAVHPRHAPTTGAYLYNNLFQAPTSTDWGAYGGYPIIQSITGATTTTNITATNNKWLTTIYPTNLNIVGIDPR